MMFKKLLINLEVIKYPVTQQFILRDRLEMKSLNVLLRKKK